MNLKKAVAAEAKARQVRKPKSVVPTLAPQTSGKTRDELAKMANVSHGTLAKVEKIVAEAEPEVVEAARKGGFRPPWPRRRPEGRAPLVEGREKYFFTKKIFEQGRLRRGVICVSTF